MIAFTARQAHMIFGVPVGRLRVWLHRGHITRTPDGHYDATSIELYLRRREHRPLDSDDHQV